MKNSKRLVFLCALLITSVSAVFGQGPPLAPTEFKDSPRGFVYTPPPNLRDLTSFGRQSIQESAAARGVANTLTLLLSLVSGPDDTAADWRTIAIQTYPREKLRTLADREAILKFSRGVARNGKEVGEPSDVTIGDFHFVVSSFELQEGQLTKHARVYSTIRNGLMLSFAFSANSLDVLDSIVTSMKTLRPLELIS
jgi:hypothetical protein